MFSFCFLVHNEGKDYLEKLFADMYKTLLDDEEIIICDDNSTDASTLEFFENTKKLNDGRIKFFKHSLNGDFAAHKNFLISKCSKEYIFLMDADEFLSLEQYENIRKFINTHKNTDMFALHRTNLLTGITPDDCDILEVFKPYRNRVINENTVQVVVNCYQMRIWKNKKGIHYVNKVHEVQTGFRNSQNVPENIASIMHIKSCSRQKAQADFYKQFN